MNIKYRKSNQWSPLKGNIKVRDMTKKEIKELEIKIQQKWEKNGT